MPQPNLRQIEAFKAVVESGSVSRAAEVLRISQPAVSKLISHFEYAVGFAVFDRVRGRLVPTTEGMMLYREVDRVFAGIQQITRSAEAIRSLKQGQLMVGVMPALAGGFFQDVAAEFLRERPDVRLTVHARSSQFIADWLVNKQLDIGFANIPLDHPLLECEVLARNPLVCLLPNDHPLATRDTIRPEDLAGEPFISFGESSVTRTRVDQLFEERGIQRIMRIEATTAPAVCEFVIRGVGVSLCDRLPAEPWAGRLALRRFEPRIMLDLVMALPPNHRNAALSTALAETARRVAKRKLGRVV
jgi:DNA-binding transcriptional LysR family regulator